MKVDDPKASRKAEYSGLVANDSLAADSLRSGGPFSKGNPTGISDVPASKGTFAGNINKDDIADVHYGKANEKVKLGKGEAINRIGNVSSVGGKTMEEAFSGNYEGAGKTSTTFTKKSEHRGGRGTRHTGGASNAERHAEDLAKTEESRPETQPRQFASLQKKSISPEEISAHDTETTTDIGSEEDPGRSAEQKFIDRNAGEEAILAGPGRSTPRAERTGNPFEALSEE